MHKATSSMQVAMNNGETKLLHVVQPCHVPLFVIIKDHVKAQQSHAQPIIIAQ